MFTLKILDSTFIIAVLGDLKRPELIECILKLNHDLAISNSVYCEVLQGPYARLCTKLIGEKKFKVENVNKRSELIDLQKTHPYLGLGEIDTILTYEKLAGHDRAFCILDDKQARRVAKSRNVSFTGTLGILCLMRDRQIFSENEFQEIVDLLRRSGFRLPKEIC